MKNTMQRYIILYVLEHKIEENFLKLTTINLKTAFAHRFEWKQSVFMLVEIQSKRKFI